MKEVVYSIEEFKAKVHWLTFRMFGISKDGNHIIVFEDKQKVTIWDIPQQEGNVFERLDRYLKDCYHKLVEKYAKPLGSTEGEWKE